MSNEKINKLIIGFVFLVICFFLDRFSKNPDVIRVKRENNALFTNAVEEFKGKWKPSYNLDKGFDATLKDFVKNI